jgi:tRNA-binding EMAP/Myf-like protein
MKFSLSWLKTHLRTDAPLRTITDTLTRIGLELEGVEDPAAALGSFRIAHVVEAVQHPNADRLRVCTVDTGDGIVSVVCGAPNARTGMKGVFAAPGSFIPGTNVTLQVGQIRGVQSAGMLLSQREMGLGDDHSGIVDLPPDAPVGVPYIAWAGLDDPGQRHPQSRRLLFRARHRARPGGGGARHAAAVRAAPHRAAVLRRPTLEDRMAGGVPVDPRSHHPRRQE